MSIRNLSPDVAMHHMLTTLRPGPFADNLCMQPADSLDELRKRAAKYMQLEELWEFHNQARVEAGGEKNKEEKDRQGQPSQRNDRRRDNRDRPIRFSRYTPLTTERGRILDEALNAELIPPPRKVASPNNADRRKQCRYHQNTGHSTDECQALKARQTCSNDIASIGRSPTCSINIASAGRPLAKLARMTSQVLADRPLARLTSQIKAERSNYIYRN